MNFEDYSERITDPKVIFESIVENFADEDGLELSILNENADFLEFELLEASDDEGGVKHRIFRADTEDFLKEILKRLEAGYPEFNWRNVISTGFDVSLPTTSIYIDYKLLQEPDSWNED
jgi:hypothetical protein